MRPMRPTYAAWVGTLLAPEICRRRALSPEQRLQAAVLVRFRPLAFLRPAPEWTGTSLPSWHVQVRILPVACITLHEGLSR